MECYGFITKFSDICEHEVKSKIDFMVKHLRIYDFQFYDVFYNYSQPMPIPSSKIYETKCSQLLGKNKNTKQEVDLRVVRTYIDRIHYHGGRAWLYVQSIADEKEYLTGYHRIPNIHFIDNNPLFYCYYPDVFWAQRMCDIWIPFALYMKFDGIHWDSLGYLDGLGDGSIFTSFLRFTYEELKRVNLLQTFNFVDGYGWNPDLIKDNTLHFPYWEVWTLPDCEDKFFEIMRYYIYNQPSRLPVLACHPYGKHNPIGYSPYDLACARQSKCNLNNIRYLRFGDGNRSLKTEYLPDTDFYKH